jgi:hypothetical protein
MTYEGKLKAALQSISDLSRIVDSGATKESIYMLRDICHYHATTNHTNIAKYTLDEKGVLDLGTHSLIDTLSKLASFRITYLTPEQVMGFNLGSIAKQYDIELSKNAMFNVINECTKLRSWRSLYGKIRMSDEQMKGHIRYDLAIGMKFIKTPIVPVLEGVIARLSKLTLPVEDNVGSIPSEMSGIIRVLALQAMITITIDRCIELICWTWDNANDIDRNVVVKDARDIQTIRVDIGNISKYYATNLGEVVSAVHKFIPADKDNERAANPDIITKDGFVKNLPELISIMSPLSSFGVYRKTTPESNVLNTTDVAEAYFNYRQYVQKHLTSVTDVENYFADIDPNDVPVIFKELIARELIDFDEMFRREGHPYPNEVRPFAHPTLTEEQTVKDMFAIYADAVVKIWNAWITLNLSKPIRKTSYTTKMSINNIPALTREALHGRKDSDDKDLVVESLIESIDNYYSKIDDKLSKIKALCEAYDVDPQNIPQNIFEDVTKIAPKGGDYGKGIKAVFKKILDFFNKFLINGITNFTSTIEGAKKGVEWVKTNKTKLIDASTRFSDEDEVTSKPYNYKAPYDRLLGIDALSKNLIASVKDVTGKINEVANKITPNSTADEITAAEASVPEVNQTTIGKEIQKTYPEAVNQDLTFDSNVLKSFVLFGKANKDDVVDQTYTGDGCKQRYSDAVTFLTDDKIQALINGIDYTAFKTDATALSDALKSLADKKAAALNKKPDDQKPAEPKPAGNDAGNPPPAEKNETPPPAGGAKNESLYIMDRFKAMLEADDVKVNPDPNAKADTSGDKKETAMEQRTAEYLRAVERLLKVTFECLQDSYVDAYNFVTMYYKILKNRAPATQTTQQNPAPEQK